MSRFAVYLALLCTLASDARAGADDVPRGLGAGASALWKAFISETPGYYGVSDFFKNKSLSLGSPHTERNFSENPEVIKRARAGLQYAASYYIQQSQIIEQRLQITYNPWRIALDAITTNWSKNNVYAPSAEAWTDRDFFAFKEALITQLDRVRADNYRQIVRLRQERLGERIFAYPPAQATNVNFDPGAVNSVQYEKIGRPLTPDDLNRIPLRVRGHRVLFGNAALGNQKNLFHPSYLDESMGLQFDRFDLSSPYSRLEYIALADLYHLQSAIMQIQDIVQTTPWNKHTGVLKSTLISRITAHMQDDGMAKLKNNPNDVYHARGGFKLLLGYHSLVLQGLRWWRIMLHGSLDTWEKRDSLAKQLGNPHFNERFTKFTPSLECERALGAAPVRPKKY